MGSVLRNTQNLRKGARRGGALVILALGKQSQVDTWGSLTSQSALFGKLRTNKRPSQRRWIAFPRIPLTCTPAYLHAHTKKKLSDLFCLESRTEHLTISEIARKILLMFLNMLSIFIQGSILSIDTFKIKISVISEKH